MTTPRVVRPGVDISSWADQKWARGMAHLNALTVVARAWEAGGHVWAELKLSDGGHLIDATLRMNASPPLEEMALHLGDAVHCFRSALDSLAWSLCHLDGAEPAKPHRVYFPCVNEESKWNDAASTLSSMPSELLERIRQVQPFVTGSGSPLKLLAELSNQDKHRGMISGRANPSTFGIGFGTDGATGSRNGIENGMRMTLLNDQHELADGLPFVRVETSVPVSLDHDREPVGLQYLVTVGGQDHLLGDVQRALIGLRAGLLFVREGPAPAAPTNVGGEA